MAFWGIEVKPGKPYSHLFDIQRGRLHVSQATLGTGSSTKKSIVQCNVGDKKPIYLCSLLPEKIETCQLNLEFEEEDEVTFSVVGPHSVHLSGFFYGETEDDNGSDSYGEDIAYTDSEAEESTDSDSEDDEDDFINDDIDMFPPSNVPNSGVRIEEIFDDDKLVNENGGSKRPKKKNSKSNESDDISQQQIVVKDATGLPILESEDEDGFPVSSGKEKTEKVKDKATVEEMKAEDEPARIKNVKRKIDAIKETDEGLDSSVPTIEALPDNDVKQTKKKKKKIISKEGKEHETGDSKSNIQPEATTGGMDEILVVEKENDRGLNTERSLETDRADENSSKEKKKKKKKNKNKKQESTVDANTKQNVTDKNGSTMEKEEKDEAKTKPKQVRSFPNGLVIEELEMGKPDGKRASPGKKVSVRYIGKLQKNGKIFDSNIGKAPLKFRLGVAQVIKGWDVGVNGMRVGDKRRLTIPPAMGYGTKGAGQAIPPNSVLQFDVELVEVS